MATDSSYSRTRLALGALLAAAAGSAATFIVLRVTRGEIDIDIASVASIFLLGLLFGMALHFPTMVMLILVLILIGGYAPSLLRRELTLTLVLAGVGALAGIAMALIISGYFSSGRLGEISTYAVTSMAVGGIILGVMISRGSNRLALRG
jgi:hypothetical protein